MFTKKNLYENLNLSEKLYIFFTIFLTLFLILTSSYPNYSEILSLGYSDSVSYLCVLSFQCGDFQPILHHAQRWPSHLIVQLFSKVFGLDVIFSYRFFIFLLMLVTIKIIQLIPVSVIKRIAIFSMILFNPYTFRLYFAIPTMISDCLVLVGFLVFIVGVLNNNLYQILIGVFISIIFKQTGLLLAPFLLIFLYFKYVSFRTVKWSILLIFLSSAFIIISTKLFFNAIEENQSANYIELFTGISLSKNIFSFFLSDSGESFYLIEFLKRYILALVTLAPLLMVSIKNKQLYLFVFIFFSIHAQPILAGPMVTGGNIQRLILVGIPFLIPIFLNVKLSTNKIILFIAILILGSFHHNFSIINSFHYSRELFFVLILVVSLVSLIAFLVQEIKSRVN
jgi:hypothetical protein